jgi:hypothetical protein
MIHTTMKHMETRLLLVAFFMIGSIVKCWNGRKREKRCAQFHKPSHTNTNAHQLHQGNFEFCHWRKFDISKSFVKWLRARWAGVEPIILFISPWCMQAADLLLQTCSHTTTPWHAKSLTSRPLNAREETNFFDFMRRHLWEWRPSFVVWNDLQIYDIVLI